MSMQNIGILNNKITAQSVSYNKKPQDAKQPAQQNEPKQQNSNKNLFIGATAVAGIVIAGILLARGRKTKNITQSPPKTQPPTKAQLPTKSQITTPDYNPDDYRQLPFVKENIEKEKQIRNKIVAYFKAFRDGKGKPNENFENTIGLYRENDWEKFKSYLDFRSKNVRNYSNEKIPADLREMDTEDVDAVLSFMKNHNKINTPLRNGENLSKTNEVVRLNKLIEEAEPLKEDVYVFRGVRTKQLYDDFKDFDFNELDELEIGDTIIDKAFVSTARTYDTELASVDPLLLDDPHKNSGYIMRIKLPKGTKGFDCRRLTQINSNKGTNSTYILPSNSEFKITGWDAPRRILDCTYVLPE